MKNLCLILVMVLAACGSDPDPALNNVNNTNNANNSNNANNANNSNNANNNTNNVNNTNNLQESGRAWVVGESVEGRPIVAELYGQSGPVLTVVAAIHGDERMAVSHGERIRTFLRGGAAERVGVQVIFIQALNPDGIRRNTRTNANGIDMNRNFPADNFDPSAGGGSEPLSEPEAVAFSNVFDAVPPTAVLSFHCCAADGQVDWDGPGDELAEEMHAAANEDPQLDYELARLGSRPGSMGSWVGLANNVPIITWEFSAFVNNAYIPPVDLDGAERAVLAAMDWVKLEGPDVTNVASSIGDLGIEIAHFAADGAATSAGGLPIVTTRVGASNDNVGTLVSGIDLTGRLGEHVAEFVRRDLIDTADRDYRLTLSTLVNPDAVNTLGPDNADGVDIRDDLNGAMQTDEAQFVEDLIQNAAELVFVFEDAPSETVTVLPDATPYQAALGGFTVSNTVPANYRPMVDRWVGLGKTVVFVGIDSEHYEAQNVDDGQSPARFADLVRDILAQ